MEDDPSIPLTDPDLVRLVLAQLDAVAVDVEQHASEVGMLLESLLSLIERHAAAARPAGAALGAAEGPDSEARQLERDHETMRAFAAPLLVAGQFYDRLRQRLEHLRSAVARLPATPALARAHLAAAAELFPFDEERVVGLPVAGAPEESEADARVELF